eukprot:XP_011431247.1 PREDICTED: uncharacterized protein LOC105330966 [Crassostrea gigas]
MYVILLRLFLLSVYVCHTSGLLNHDDSGTPSLDDVLDSLNDNDLVPERKITIGDLKTVILALQKDYTSRLNTLKSDFELSLRSQQNRIRYLEKKVAYQGKLIEFLETGESFRSRQTQPANKPQPHVHNASNDIEAKNSTAYSFIDIKEMQNENWSGDLSGHPKLERQERLLIQEIPTSSAVVAFYAYMSKSLISNVATPHHVLIFDVVRTNIGNAYHSSTGVFIVPETGVYVFIWSFLNGNNDAHSTQLMINTEEWGIVHAHSASNNWNQSTGVIVAHVNKGDDVFVKTSGASQGEIYSGVNSRTMFAGWKLH